MYTIFRLSKNACLECLREPVFYLMLVSALIMIGLFPYCSMFVFRQQIKLVVDSSMATTLLFGLFAAVLCSGRTISREMRNGTVLLLMSKPVTRLQFVLSKMLGILLALTLFVFICDSASWLSVLVAVDQFRLSTPLLIVFYGAIVVAAIFGGICNFFAQKSFPAYSTFAMAVIYLPASIVAQVIRTNSLSEIFKADNESYLPPNVLIPSLLLLFFAVWAMGIISSTLSIRFDLVGNLLICLIIFICGIVLHYFAARVFGAGSAIALFCTAIIPNWQLYWMADALANRGHIPILYFVWAIFYTLFHIAIWGGWAYYLFRDNELAKDTR